VTPDGSSLRRLTEHSNANSLFWSPNGKSILFTADSPNDLSEGNIAVVGADGRDLRRLASNARALGWSPDGKKVLYSHRDGLWLMDADGGRPTRLAMAGPGHELTIITADWGSF
jgi:Tol biopolymer transport system component